MTVRRGRARRMGAASTALGLTMATALVLTACGDPQSAGEGERQQPTTTALVRTDLESVAEAWGVAMLTNDVASWVALLKPTDHDQIQPQLDDLEALAPPGDVELRDLEVEVTQDGDSAEVRYSGTRCAPTITKRFGPTSVVGDTPDPTSLTSDGEIIEGEVVCADLSAMEDGPFWPARLVRIDGQWYGTLPGV